MQKFRFLLTVHIFLPCRKIKNENFFLPLRRLFVILCLLLTLVTALNTNLTGRLFCLQIKDASLDLS